MATLKLSPATCRLIRPAHLNHHGCLYGGIVSEWMTEASFVGLAALLQRTNGVVMAALKDLSITRSMYPGTVLQLDCEVIALGSTSITLEVTGKDLITKTPYCRAVFVFVNVDEAGKKQPHGLTM